MDFHYLFGYHDLLSERNVQLAVLTYIHENARWSSGEAKNVFKPFDDDELQPDRPTVKITNVGRSL